MIMKIALYSDVHANLSAFKAMLFAKVLIEPRY